MVAGSRIEGGTQIISAGVRKTIQSIKEIVGNYSDFDIYWALKETDMDPNETAQKLLNQEPFHIVKRKRDKRKEVSSNSNGLVPVDARRHFESAGQGPKSNTSSDRPPSQNTTSDRPSSHSTFSDRPSSHSTFSDRPSSHNTFSDRNVRRGGYARGGSTGTGISREFRVVRDNRINGNVNKEMKPASPQCTTSTNEQASNDSEGGQTASSNSQKPSSRQNSSHGLNGQTRIRSSGANSTVNVRTETLVEKRVTLPNAASRVQAGKPNNSQPHSPVVVSSNSVVGVYSSSTDPVHVPSPDSRPAASVGAIKREVGIRRQASGNSKPSAPADQVSQTSESVIPSMLGNRPLLSNQHNVRPHPPPVGHQKASQTNKEWKPKSSQKPSSSSPGVIGTPTMSISPASGDSKVSESEAAKLQDKLALVNVYDNCNVVIAQSIRVPDSDRFQLTFGSLGTELDSTGNIVNGFQAGDTEESNREAAASLSVSAPELCSDEASGIKPVDLLDHQVRSSGSESPVSGAIAEHQLPEKKETSSPQNLGNYADIGLVQDNSSSYAPSDSQQQDPSELQGFSAFDSQTGYDIPYFRPNMEESHGQGLPPPQEALSSHTVNSMAASTVAMVQQQPPPVAQMYPQVHVSHYANLMPYRQFLSPVYVPPMAVPGYSNNPAYPHLSNGNSYLLMPGGGSHLNANSLKYGVQQFKPVPAGSPTGFGNFTNPNGYAINSPGVGGATGLEDSSRIKYKDGNLYVPNAQAETSEIWIQSAREHPGMQSTPYYNMPAQSPHGAYMPSHGAHASFNAAAQSSHLQFPGLYHPPQPSTIPNPHHMGPAMGGNVGVGVGAVAPGAQVGAYQQPQLNHLNWQSNF
ncbi:uncharacterized protein [Pyrus communis]|uniref:uncharacterized protein isoform X3 n=1 Tax=Pyrus communis TaxID=23211 RepID=UPI0035C1BB12